MNRLFLTIITSTAVLFSCHTDQDDIVANPAVNFSVSHHWDGTAVTNSDFNQMKFTNANGETLSIERLRYLISDFSFTHSDGTTYKSNSYHLIDLSKIESLELPLDLNISAGNYTNVSFVFGLTNEKNIDGTYADLNSVSFNVPAMMGGGYHYMQFDGKFINSSAAEQGFNYHAIRAVDNAGANLTFPQDTFFTVNLGAVEITADTTINIGMNIAEWFANPNTWDLNQYNQMLMPNSMAQIMMYENGQNVFSLISVEN